MVALEMVLVEGLERKVMLLAETLNRGKVKATKQGKILAKASIFRLTWKTSSSSCKRN